MRTLSKTRNSYYFLKKYIQERPLFLSLTRSRESSLYQPYLPFTTPVLDLGCGDGYFAKETFSKRHPELVSGSQPNKKEILKRVQHGMELIDIGLDLTESRIKQAQQQGIYRKLVTYDGVRIPFPNNYFKTIVSNCVLEHIPDIDQTLT